MRRTYLSLRWAGLAWLAAQTPLAGNAQPAPPATSIEIEEDVEVPAQPAPPSARDAAPPSAAPAAPPAGAGGASASGDAPPAGAGGASASGVVPPAGAGGPSATGGVPASGGAAPAGAVVPPAGAGAPPAGAGGTPVSGGGTAVVGGGASAAVGGSAAGAGGSVAGAGAPLAEGGGASASGGGASAGGGGASAGGGGAPAGADAAPAGTDDPLLGIRWSAYVQAQYEASQRSEDQLQQGGEPLNRNRFLVRRARLRLQRSWEYAGLDVELDANTVRDVSVGLRRAAGAVFWPGAPPDGVPYVRAQLGLLDIPFGYELPAGARGRLFAERSTASQAFFPSEADVGAAVDGGYGPLRYALAIMNGVEADGAFRVRDPNAAKDILARVGVELAPVEILRVIAGVSFVEGTGFHPGSDATKNTLEWNDVNEDGSKTDAEVFGEPGRAAEPSKNFDRWGVGFDARVGLQTALGWSWLYGEVSFGQNLDRALFIADPVAASLDARELGYYIALVQEITPYAIVGFRADFYDGNSDFIERRRGRAFKQPQTVRTYSPVVGVVLPGRARLTFQYDFIDDTFGRDRRGEPADSKNNQWTLRLQVGL